MKTIDKSLDKNLDQLKQGTKKADTLQKIESLKSLKSQYSTVRDRIIGLIFEGKKNDALTLASSDEAKIVKKIEASIHSITKVKIDRAEERYSSDKVSSRHAILFICLAAGSGTLVALLLGLYFAASITRPINRIVWGLGHTSGQVASASSQVAGAGRQFSEGASEQAASIEETSSALEELSSMTKQNAESANHANQLMLETGKTVSRASQSMAKLTASMSEISSASDETSKIIETIDEIAFQTNLLALNAAVEAARAGEAGAGFAVVADEVRNLAMRAADAAKNTAGLIEGTIKRVREGSEIATKTNLEFQDVASTVSKSGELVGEIAAASNEQAQGIEQVNKAMADMDKVVQQNSATAEETASASEEMNAQAEKMREYVSALVALVGRRKENGAKERSKPKFMEKTERNLSRRSLSEPALHSNEYSNGNGSTILKSRYRELSPEKLIPLTDTDLEDF